MWIAETEKEILAGKYNTVPDKTFGDLMDRYGKQVSPTKRYPEHEMWVTESQAKAWAVYQLQGKFLVHIRSENKV